MDSKPRMTDEMHEAKLRLVTELDKICEAHDLSHNELLVVIAAASVRYAPR